MSEISPLLAQGLRSLSEGDDRTAFDALTQVVQHLQQMGQLQTSDGWKAQMGLVTIHQRAGNLTIARDLALQLTTARSSKVKAWANSQLAAIEATPSATWIKNSPSSSPSSSSLDEVSDDRTGFVPLDDATLSPRRRRNSPTSGRSDRAAGQAAAGYASEEIRPEMGISEQDWSSPEMVNSLALASFDSSLPYDRATQWRNLPPAKNLNLPLIQILTTIGLVGIPALWIGSLQWSAQIFGELKNKVPFLGWQQPMAIEIPWVPLSILAIVAVVVSPWLIRLQLQRAGSVKTLSTGQLSQYSPEAYRILQRHCKTKKKSIPRLEIIDTDLSLVLSYGVIPQQQCIAVSRSVLTQLNDGEIASIYALEVSHLHNWTTAILSSTTSLALLPYLCYWECSKLGDRFLALALQPSKIKPLSLIWQLAGNTFGIVASVSYGVFSGLRWMGLWLSRSRSDQADRNVCDLTGNPNGLASMLMQLRSSMAINLNHPNAFLLEALEHLLPIARQESATTPLSSVESWWTLNQSQRPTELRLARLGTIAQQWNLTPILSATAMPNKLPSEALRTWATPFTWAIGGYLIALAAWGLGWISFFVGQPRLAFLGSDYALFIGLSMLGFGLGTWMRFNTFFPELTTAMSRCDRSNLNPQQLENLTNENLALISAFSHPHATPLKPQLAMLQGRLAGRSGVANWLGQDLWLEMPSGDKIKLHFGSSLGPLGLLLREVWNDRTLGQSVGETVTVSGWLRRGGTLWMDVEAARSSRSVMTGGHQIWSILIGGLFVGVGIFVML
jgi:Zn-dependent protease with chaperone function